ncbi:MAG: lipid-A-disaccharide synthase [Proteobacteria bacterium]|nr:lipid-A-disaccharide synthase [Pseudomonadota bacterium]HQR02966.1 lipid-A-disaccharide synthase [Rhodocyclaceae bacterium]
MNGPRIALVAGEASGDLLASHLIHAIRSRQPDARFYGIGGPKMQAAGMEILWPAEMLAVRGYAEVLRHYRKITGIRRQLLRLLRKDPPAAFIGVDAPDFNLWLEQRLKRSGIPAIHYVSPSIWAWRGGRIRRIAQSVTRILALFPFEPPLYEKMRIPVSYVGHPLADVMPLHIEKQAAREKLGIDVARGPVFALLPGSRQSELHYMADTFIQTGKRLLVRFPQAQFLVPTASRETRNLFEAALWRNDAQNLPFAMLFGHAPDAMAAADVSLVASGTATLEAALIKRPHVIAYKMSPWSWRLMRRMRYQPWVGLPNILAGRFAVPEFLQDEATPENLAQAMGNLVNDRDVTRRLELLFAGIHHTLRQDTAEKAASAVLASLAYRQA